MAAAPGVNREKFERVRLKFETFIAERGAEVLVPTSEWELCRFRHGDTTAVIYTNKHGQLSWTGGAEKAFQAYAQGLSWRAMPATRKLSKSSPTCLTLRHRDGDKCFYCHQHVLPEEESVEHLVNRTHGGPDHIANMALAHGACNMEVGNLSLMQKILVREGTLTRLQAQSAGVTLAMPVVVPDLQFEPALQACREAELLLAVPAADLIKDEIDRSPPWDTK